MQDRLNELVLGNLLEKQSKMKTVTIYTDGACSGNPGRFIPEKTDKSGAVQKCRSAFLLGLFVNFPNFTGKKEENFYGNGSEPARSFRSILASAVMLNVDSGKTPTERNCER